MTDAELAVIRYTVEHDMGAIYARDLTGAVLAAWKYGPMRATVATWVQHRERYTDQDAEALCEWLNKCHRGVFPYDAPRGRR